MNKIWIILVLLSGFAFSLGFLELIGYVTVAILLASTFLKAQLVIDYFMDLKDVELKYRLIPTIWLVVVICLVAIAYYLPS